MRKNSSFFILCLLLLISYSKSFPTDSKILLKTGISDNLRLEKLNPIRKNLIKNLYKDDSLEYSDSDYKAYKDYYDEQDKREKEDKERRDKEQEERWEKIFGKNQAETTYESTTPIAEKNWMGGTTSEKNDYYNSYTTSERSIYDTNDMYGSYYPHRSSERSTYESNDYNDNTYTTSERSIYDTNDMYGSYYPQRSSERSTYESNDYNDNTYTTSERSIYDTNDMYGSYYPHRSSERSTYDFDRTEYMDKVTDDDDNGIQVFTFDPYELYLYLSIIILVIVILIWACLKRRH